MLLTHQWILVAADCLLCSAGWVSEIDAVSFSKRECAHSVHSAPPAPLVWISIFSFSFYARLCLFSQRVCMPLSCAVITNTVSIHVPPPPPAPRPRSPTVTILPVRPHSWTVDPGIGVWPCQGLMLVTSPFAMSPLPPPALLSIVRPDSERPCSGGMDGAGAARSLCKWWKSAGPRLAEPRWTPSWLDGAFSPLTVTSVICGDKKKRKRKNLFDV